MKNEWYLYAPPVSTRKAKGTLLILHGMMEHGGRYADFAQFLSIQGYAVLIYDHLGHGKTAQSESEIGYFRKEKPGDALIEDAQKMAVYLKTLYPDVPHFLLGHSMGSFIARSLLRRNPSLFDGAIIMGTGYKIFASKYLVRMLSVLNHFWGRHRSRLINTGFSYMNNRHFKKEKNDGYTNWLSADRKNRQNFQNDPLCGVPFSVNGFYGLLSVYDEATHRNWHLPISKEFPFLFLSGADDPIGNFGKGVDKTVWLLRKAGFTNVNEILYSGLRHEILNEAEHQVVFRDILFWLDKQTDSSRLEFQT